MAAMVLSVKVDLMHPDKGCLDKQDKYGVNARLSGAWARGFFFGFFSLLGPFFFLFARKKQHDRKFV